MPITGIRVMISKMRQKIQKTVAMPPSTILTVVSHFSCLDIVFLISEVKYSWASGQDQAATQWHPQSRRSIGRKEEAAEK